MADDDIQFEDTENYSNPNKDGLSIQSIVLEQYKGCCREGAKEMTEGGIFSRFIDGQLIEVAVANQREIFTNHVEMLRITLVPEIDRLHVDKDKVIKDKFLKFDDDIKRLENGYMLSLDKVRVNYFQRSRTSSNAEQEYNFAVKQIKNTYEIQKVIIYRGLLIAISYLLNHLNYFQEQDFIGMFTQQYDAEVEKNK